MLKLICCAILALLHSLCYTLLGFFKLFVPYEWLAKDVDGEVVLITGGGSGIGRLLALKLAKLGCKIIIWDINTKGNQETLELLKNLGYTGYAYTVDISSYDEVKVAAAKVKKEVGIVTMLINNAGIGTVGSFLTVDPKVAVKTMEINGLAHCYTIREFLPDMIEHKKGHLVTIASLAGCFGINNMSHYCSSKYAAVGLHEALTAELWLEESTKHINTTLVCPYFIGTAMFPGVQSKVVSVQDPHHVVNSIVRGVRLNSTMVVVPSYLKMFMLLKWTTAFEAYMALYKRVGGDETTRKMISGK